MKELIAEEYKRIVRYFEILFIILLIIFLYNLYTPVSPHHTFYLSGKSIESTADELERYGYTVTPIDQLFIYIGEIPQEGWYHINKKKQSRFKFFSELYKQRADLMNIVVYAGETANELTQRVANDMKLDRVTLLKAYQKRSIFKEADLFAAHYTVARKADEFTLIQYLFDQSHMMLNRFEKEYFSQKPKNSTIRILLTIASIIQKESNTPKEMPLISSVIYNRLERKMKLQMDATLNYGDYSHVIVSPERIKTDQSYFNTYKYKGLPPYPLGTVTMEALEAAMMPAKSNYLFFMLSPNGAHSFSATYKEHLKKVKDFRDYQTKRSREKKTEENITAATNTTKESL